METYICYNLKHITTIEVNTMEQSYSETPGTSHIENTQSQNDAPGPSNVSIERSNVMRVHDILGTDSQRR
uniref:Uncharacterized protein n=1 Tax=Acrobeloides nanus TaxID=290746 RepID=A0A914D258_9BILA